MLISEDIIPSTDQPASETLESRHGIMNEQRSAKRDYCELYRRLVYFDPSLGEK